MLSLHRIPTIKHGRGVPPIERRDVRSSSVPSVRWEPKEIAGVNVLEAVKAARESKAAQPNYPTVRDAVLDYIKCPGAGRGATREHALNYRDRVWKCGPPSC